MRSIRDAIQEKAYEAWKRDKKGIILCAPRTGKTFIASKAFSDYKKITICYPRKDIQESWEDTFQKLGISQEVTWSTFRGLKNVVLDKDELLVVDEVHELSSAQRDILDHLVESNDTMGLTGTLTRKSEDELMVDCGLQVCYRYSIQEAVRNGILADYRITVHLIPLDNKSAVFGSKKVTERVFYKNCIHIKNPVIRDQKLDSIIKGSISKVDKTLELLKKYENDRVLVFCGLTEVADSLGIPVYHSKDKDEELFLQFCRGEGHNHMATIMMAQAGINIKPINRIVAQHITGSSENSTQKLCRALAQEDAKITYIDVLCSDVDYQKQRMKSALQWFDKTKINYI